MRAIFTPTFTSGKIKAIYNILDTCAKELVQIINDSMKFDGETIIDCGEISRAFSMGSAISSVYGIRLKDKMDDKDKDDFNRNLEPSTIVYHIYLELRKVFSSILG